MTTMSPVLALGQDPSPRPTSPSTRFAPTLCHSATWASPPPSDRSVLSPSRRAPASAPLRPTNASRFRSLALPPRFVCWHPELARPSSFNAVPRGNFPTPAPLAVGNSAHVRLAGAGCARHRLPHFAILYCPFHCQPLCPSLRQFASHVRRRLRQHPLHQRNLLGPSGFNAMPHSNVPTPARLAASGDLASLMALRLAALVAGAVHVRVVGAGFASSSVPVTSFMFTTLPTLTAMSCPLR